MRRWNDPPDSSSPFIYPYPKENYAYDALQGAVVSAVVLERQGVSVKTASSSALRRAYQAFMRSADWQGGTPFPLVGEDNWQPWLEQCLYGTASSTPPSSTSPGKGMAWTNWTHARRHRQVLVAA